MARHTALLLTTVLAIGLTACATVLDVVQTTQDPTLKQVVAAVPMSDQLAHRIELYQKYAEKYQRFHDSGVLDDSDVLDVLRDTGVVKGGPTGTRPPRETRKNRPPVQVYSGQYLWPTDAGVVSSEYGRRWGKAHKGVDIAAETGEPVKASATGTVIYSGSGLRGYGNVLIVRHDEKTTTLYAHNSKLLARKGQKVKGGQTIALLGSTGASTGPHVHFEFREGDQPIDPRTRLGRPPYALTFSESFPLLADTDGIR